jgi:hypothetical protein
MLVNVVMVAEPNMLRGSLLYGTGIPRFTRHGQIVPSDLQPAYRADLTHRVDSAEQSKSVLLPAKGKVHRKGYRRRCGDETREKAKAPL